MSTIGPSVAGLSGPGMRASKGAGAVPMPRSRWKTRLLLPLGIVLIAAGLLAYAARGALLPAVAVRVVPVMVVRTEAQGSGEAAQVVVAQAPGWIEPLPFAITVPALTEGVIREVLVLEGDEVVEGQVVARMIDDEAKIAVQMATAERDERAAMLGVAEARHASQLAMAAAVRDTLSRQRSLLADRAATEADITRLELELEAREAEARAGQAEIAGAEAALRRAEAALADAHLRLDRMEIRAPAGGVVLSRLVEPGSRMMLGADDPFAASVLRLYDPTRLQARVDVPLADAAKVGLDQEVEVLTEALPGRSFKGKVIRLVQEANIQKNTVQVKAAVLESARDLKPEMLVRVRFLSRQEANPAGAAGSPTDVVLAPVAAIVDRTERTAACWIVDLDGPRARRVEVQLGSEGPPGWIAVKGGLRAGDKVVVDPPAVLREGARVAPREAEGGGA